MLIKPTFEEINSLDLSPLYDLWKFRDDISGGGSNYLQREAGQEHYKLLAWFSTKFNNVDLIEVGTCDGAGLISLSYNKSNRVISYDVMDYNPKHIVPDNGERRICSEGFNKFDEIINSPFIFYDANHNGKTEREFLDGLVSRNWKGILVFDDIHFNHEMSLFWNSISQRKEDWTDIGHGAGGIQSLYCGTGIVFIE